MKKSTKDKIAQDVFTFISEGYKNGANDFHRDEIVKQIKISYPKLPGNAVTREIDRHLRIFCDLGILVKSKTESKSLKGVILILSELAPTILVEDAGKSFKYKKSFYEFADEINDRQYRMYSWYTTKFQNLLTVGSFLFAGIVLIISSFCSSEFNFNNLSVSNKWFAALFLITTGVSLLALAVSVGVGLFNLIPKLSSKIGGNEDNIRSLIGMKRFLALQKNLGKTEEGKNYYPASFHYYDDFKNLNDEQRLKFTVFQCIGMGKNNLESELQLRIASILMITAFVAGVVSIICYGLYFIF